MRKRCQLGDDDWEAEMLTRMSEIPFRVAKNVINMLRSDCTIPFIARYRTDRTDSMSADKLRLAKDNYEYIK